MSEDQNHHSQGFFYKVEGSFILTIIGIFLLFSSAILVTLVAPRFIDKAWIEPSSYYQVQMYTVADPHLYVGRTNPGSPNLQFVHHLQEGFTLLAFVENENTRIVAPPELDPYITHLGEKVVKLTPKLLLLRPPLATQATDSFNAFEAAEKKRKELQDVQKGEKIDFTILEIYSPNKPEAFSVAETDGILESFVDHDFQILSEGHNPSYFQDPGVVFVKNPQEYRISFYQSGDFKGWRYDPNGEPIKNLSQLTHADELGFRSRKELIAFGEDIYAKEGCWYCHTDQTRTLVQDVVLNGSETYPAPPSSPNEYIYQKVTFPGTRRIGPDLSRVGIKKPSRDWHRGHFWAPKTASPGTIMPAFQHFFDIDPRGTGKRENNVPNYRFEAIFQYLMTKGTRITPPNQAWWLGKDPVQTLQIIDGLKGHK